MKRRFTKVSGIIASALPLSFLSAGHAVAANATNCSANGGVGFLGFPTWYEFLNPTFTNGQCELNLVFPDDLPKIGLAILEILLRIGGYAAVAFIVYGGFKYVTSQGEPDATKQARHTIQNALIGLIIALMATALVSYIGTQLST